MLITDKMVQENNKVIKEHLNRAAAAIAAGDHMTTAEYAAAAGRLARFTAGVKTGAEYAGFTDQ